MGGRYERDGSGGYLMRRTLLVCALAGFGAAGTRAAQPPVDAELLEFLGSIDSDDESWQEYLEHKPVKPADKKAKEPAKQEPKAPPPKLEDREDSKVKDK
jgi:hypothetical protein